MFLTFLVLLVGSHVLTGTVALVHIIGKQDINALIYSGVSATLLFLVALPTTFHKFRIAGYIDFASIIAAILITVITTGIASGKAPGGISAVNWSAWPREGVSFAQAFLATTNIAFAYSFTVCQYTMMSEMHTPKDYMKGIYSLCSIEMVIYTFTGATIYAFVGQDVKPLALLSAGGIYTRIAFGVAMPVIIISGSINTTVMGRFIMNEFFKTKESIRLIKTPTAKIIWVLLIATITLVAFILAEAIPIFNALLGLIGSLLISGFSFYFPSLFWFKLLKRGKWNESPKNIGLCILNGVIFLIGLIILFAGTYASVMEIINGYKSGEVRAAFTSDTKGYL